jgi:hypothetical protein
MHYLQLCKSMITNFDAIRKAAIEFRILFLQYRNKSITNEMYLSKKGTVNPL